MHTLPELKTPTLLSIGQICDNGCRVIFDALKMTVLRGNKTIITGDRQQDTGLWTVPLDQAHLATGMPTLEEQVAFAHAALFAPALLTLETALKRGFLINFPSLTAANLCKYPPQSLPMWQGHLDKQWMRQAVRPKQPQQDEPYFEQDDIPELTPATSKGERQHTCFAALQEITGNTYSDQTGAFLTTSTWGYKYIMVMYDYDSNAIIIQPTKNKTAQAMVEAFNLLHKRLTKAGFRP